MTSLANITKAVNGVTTSLAYAAELLPSEESGGKARLELTKDGLDKFFRMNGRTYTTTMRRAVEQGRKTVAASQNRGRSSDELSVDIGRVYDKLLGYFETHIGKDGDHLNLSKDEADDLGKTAGNINNRSALPRLGAIEFENVVNPQQFQTKANAVRDFLLGEAVDFTRTGRYDTWLSEDDMHRAVDAKVADGTISQEFGAAAKATFFYAAQYIYTGRARVPGWANRPPQTRSICQDMQRKFQKALNRMAGGNSRTGGLIAAIDYNEAKARLD